MPTPLDSQSGHHNPVSGDYQSQLNNTSDQSGWKISRKKAKNTASKETARKYAGQSPAREVGQSSPPIRTQSTLGQTPHAFTADSNHAVSPVLDALSSIERVSDADTSHRTDTWARSVPFGKSPPVSLGGPGWGESPPVEHRLVEGSGFLSGALETSPPVRKARPHSYGSTVQPITLRQPSTDKGRYPPGTYGSPPLPHLPQAHFFGAPEIDISSANGVREPAYEQNYTFIGFSKLPVIARSPLDSTRDCLLLGSENRLDVILVEPTKLLPIGSLEDLAGIVVGAVLLPLGGENNHFVVLTVHGPRVWRDQLYDPQERALSETESDNSEILAGIPVSRERPRTVEGPSTEYQTRVEVYSLAKRSRVTTLFETQPVTIQTNVRGFPSRAPSPQGDLRVHSCGKFVTVSSGLSGEVYVYVMIEKAPDLDWHCLGKYWTSVQTTETRRSSSSTRQVDTEVFLADQSRESLIAGIPILDLSNRWLAISPPGVSARRSIAGHVPLTLVGKVPGFDTRSAPPQPAVSCIIDSPDADTFLNKLARGVAQEVVRGARWLGDQGLQAWKAYRNPSPQVNSTTIGNAQLQYAENAALFPPTHAQDTQTPASQDRKLVSIIDLRFLEGGHGIQAAEMMTPMATFQPPGGCNFLSFSPSGLSILTSTQKGDLQYVWDLMQARHCRTASFVSSSPAASLAAESESMSPKVRQVARYARLTSSVIVDVVWNPPVGDRFALLTRNGTVHIFDLPLTVFQWPPPRRIRRHVTTASAPSSPAVLPQQDDVSSSGSILASAMRIAGKTQPMLANLRGRAPSMGGGFSSIGTNGIGFASVTGARGSKAVAAGLSKSVGAATGTVNSLRHAGENRVHLSHLGKDPAPSRMYWGVHNDQCFMKIADGPSLKSFQIKTTAASSQGLRQRASVIDSRGIGSKTIPTLERVVSISTKLHADQQTEQQRENHAHVSGYWIFPSGRDPPSSMKNSHPLAHAEIETNPPYQPFHSDRRVSLFVYANEPGARHGQNRTGSEVSVVSAQRSIDLGSQWVFGDEILTTRLNLRPPAEDDNNETIGNGSIVYRETKKTGIDAGGEGKSTREQVVVTTRRRKRKSANASRVTVAALEGEDDGFFEDECEVLDFAEDSV